MEMHDIRYCFFVFYRTIVSGSFCDYSTLMDQRLIILPKKMALIILCHKLIKTILVVLYIGILIYRIFYCLTTAFLTIILFASFNSYTFFINTFLPSFYC